MSLVDKIEGNYITIDNNKILSVVDDDNKVWLCGKHIASLLECVDHKQAFRSNIDDTNKSQYKYLKLTKSKEIIIKNFQTHTIFINEDGFKYWLCNSRSPNSVNIAKALNINLLECKSLSKETSTSSKIIKAFKGEKMIYQYTVFQCRIDLYFSDYNLAIECDENDHKDRDEEYEKKRRDKITKKIGCKWIRYDPDGKDFDIFDVINEIYTIIKNHST